MDNTTYIYYGNPAPEITNIFVKKERTVVENYKFKDLTKLENVKFEKGSEIKLLGEHCFENCKKLKNIENIPNTLLVIRDSAFVGCESLTSINLPETVGFIGDNAFDSCNLVDFIIPGNAGIGKQILSNCINLKSVTLSINTIVKIGTIKKNDEKRLGCIDKTKIIVKYPNNTKQEFKISKRQLTDYNGNLIEVRNIGEPVPIDNEKLVQQFIQHEFFGLSKKVSYISSRDTSKIFENLDKLTSSFPGMQANVKSYLKDGKKRRSLKRRSRRKF